MKTVAHALWRGLGMAAPVMAGLVILAGTTGQTGDAIANGDTRSLSLYHTHTRESATITFKRNGQFDREGLEKLNWMLRDWRHDEPTRMDPRLFDIVWEVYRSTGSSDALNVVSAYRSPRTNAALRRRSSGVAEHSQHMLGKAMDFHLPDVSVAKIREVGLRLQRGGVGYYPTSGSPFVHLDVGNVRHWPRMTRDQLARIFPDGKTVHIPSDGRPMPGYDVALAQIQANGGTAVAYAEPTLGRKSFFAALFGGADEEEDQPAPRNRGARDQKPAQVASYAPAASVRGDDDPRAFILQSTQLASSVDPAPQRPAPRIAAVAAGQAEAEAPAVTPPPEAPPPKPSIAVPVPLARPSDLAEPPPSATPATELASVAPTLSWQAGPMAGPPSDQPRAASIPVPLARPAEIATDLPPVPANVPLPPSRPVQFAALIATLPPVAQGASMGPALSGDARAYVPVSAPVPPTRPPQTAGVDKAGAADASNEVRALFSTSPAHMSRVTGSIDRVRTARAKPLSRDVSVFTAAPDKTVVMAFSADSVSDLRSDHFSGPAVRPLPVARFTPLR